MTSQWKSYTELEGQLLFQHLGTGPSVFFLYDSLTGLYVSLQKYNLLGPDSTEALFISLIFYFFKK